MQLLEAKQEFIETWGELGSEWGINRSMGQVHALLLVSQVPMCTDSIMDALDISRGCVNKSIRSLLDWGIVFKVSIEGDRKEYFSADKNIFNMFKSILARRKETELDPMVEKLNELNDTELSGEGSEEVKAVFEDLLMFSKTAQRSVNNFIKADSKFLNILLSRL